MLPEKMPTDAQVALTRLRSLYSGEGLVLPKEVAGEKDFGRLSAGQKLKAGGFTFSWRVRKYRVNTQAAKAQMELASKISDPVRLMLTLQRAHHAARKAQTDLIHGKPQYESSATAATNVVSNLLSQPEIASLNSILKLPGGDQDKDKAVRMRTLSVALSSAWGKTGDGIGKLAHPAGAVPSSTFSNDLAAESILQSIARSIYDPFSRRIETLARSLADERIHPPKPPRGPLLTPPEVEKIKARAMVDAATQVLKEHRVVHQAILRAAVLDYFVARISCEEYK